MVVQEAGNGQWTGISRRPVAIGELFVLDVTQFDQVEGEDSASASICVVESRPVVVDGDIWHRIQFHGGIMASIQFEQLVRRG